MRDRLLIALALGTALAPAALAAPASLTILPQSRVWVQGTSTVRSYTCRAARVEGAITTRPGSASLDVTRLETVVRDAEVSVAVAGLECGNATLNAQVRSALGADSNPRITYRIASYGVTPTDEAAATVKLDGTLTIAGVEKPVSIDATATSEPGRLRVRGSTQFRMSEFGVRPPTLVMGTMKVSDVVAVRFDLLLEP